MRCANCGHENPTGALFCEACGRELVPTAGRAEHTEPVAPARSPAPSDQTAPLEPAGATASRAAPTQPVGPVFAPPPAGHPAGSGGWGPALKWSGAAFLAVALVGVLMAVLIKVVGDAPLSTVDTLKLSGLYTTTFHHTGIVVEVETAAGEIPIPELPIGPGAGIEAKLGLAIMLVTGMAAFLLYRGGRAAAESSGGTPLARAIQGLKVAPLYAVLIGVVGLLTRFDPDIPANPFFSGSVRIHPSYIGAFLWPLALAVVAGAVGGLLSARRQNLPTEAWGRRAVGAVAGGWRMFVLALVFAFVGFLVLAAVNPDETRAYFEAVTEGGARPATVTITHHVVLLPNQSMLILVPAMGACDSVSGTVQGFGTSFDFLCYGRFPMGGASGAVDPLDPSSALGNFGTAPAGYFLFLLVPLIATILGGRTAARQSATGTRAEGAAVGAVAGVVYAALVLAGILFSQITLSAGGSFAGLVGGSASVKVGPDLVLGTILALVWGLAGGAIGGLLGSRGLPKRTEIVAGQS
jgi:zinc-ribbon domain